MQIYPKIVFIHFVIFAFLIGSCSQAPDKPEETSVEYQQAVSDFYISLAAIKSDEALFAVEKMRQVSENFPQEPAAWANLGVFAMRQGNFELATEHLEKALNRAKENPDILFLTGIVASRKGDIEESLRYLQKAAQVRSNDSRILFALAEELERQNAEANAEQVQTLLDQIVQQDPNNLAVLLELVRVAAKWGTQRELEASLQDLEKHSKEWPEEISEEFLEQMEAILEKEGENIIYEMAFLRNTLQQLPLFQKDLQRMQLADNQMGFLLTEFLWLPNVEYLASPADKELTFSGQSKSTPNNPVRLYKAIGLADEQPPSTITIKEDQATINAKTVLEFPDKGGTEMLPAHALATIDYNYDFLNDIAFAGEGGFAFYQQQQDSTFQEVTQSLNISQTIRQDSYYGLWTIDHELDGDLDLLLAPVKGEPQLLRNNGNGSFEEQPFLTGSKNIRDVLWSDFDLDGDADLVLLDEEGEVHFYSNDRGGKFQQDSTFNFIQPVHAVEFADMDSDGKFEVLGWQSGEVTSIHYDDLNEQWRQQQLVTLDKEMNDVQQAQIYTADLDNNGGNDLILTAKGFTWYWLSDQYLNFGSPAVEKPFITFDLADLNDDSRLDLLSMNANATKQTFLNKGSQEYNAKIIRPRGSGVTGDRRINSFGIGGEIETRSGMQYGKLPITRPWVHIGLGNFEEAEMVRIIWPNGTSQAEFAELGYDSKIMNEQILKGSCPWIYTFNGQKMEFLTDFLWKTSLGLKINAQGDAGVLHSIDWIKINENQLRPRDGFYDIRITADLWESHFFDHVSLMAVDHPEQTSVFVDERFTLPAPEQKLYPVKDVTPIVSAVDYRGEDITKKVKKLDEEFSTVPPLTDYQGLADEHYIEVEVGKDTSPSVGEWLIASGWIYPTDTSINVAISQGGQPAPKPVKVMVPDGAGGWKVAHQNIGFPSGKDKTILIDLEGIFEPNTERRVRLYTSMEIYWNQFQVGTKYPDAKLEVQDIGTATADLRYRGFSELVNTERFKPTKGNYQVISGTEQRWFNLEGFYTRYGDVTELIENTDDRYVIMNAGDELLLKFPALESPKKGWVRDFVLVGDGWVKDGDYNTEHSKTLHPLPYHGLSDYSMEPGLLQDDPVYQKYKEDWARYHTRFVEAKRFNSSIPRDK